MPIPPLTASLTYLTADLPGIGGRLKERPEDFLVEEQPLYEASGSGEHLYLFVEKRQQTTSDVVRRLAKLFGVRRSDIGYAGLKDKHAITRQHFSIYLPDPKHEEKYLSRFEFLPYTLLWARRHENKLRRGHLSSNRFVILLRQVDPTAVVVARRTLDRLCTKGVPNYIGHQRFGYRQCNHLLGRSLIERQWKALLDRMLGAPEQDLGSTTAEGRALYEADDYLGALANWPRYLRHDRQALDALRQGRSTHEAVMAIESQQLEFLINAFQSAIFNKVLDQRICDPALPFDQLVPGDLAWKHDNRSLFAVDEATAELENAPQGRVPSKQVSPSGPMWGPNMTRASGEPGRCELAALADLQMSEADLAAVDHVPVYGTRRPLRVHLQDPDVSGGVDEHGPYIRVAFDLPRGSFATVVLREVMKTDVARTVNRTTRSAEDPCS